MAAIAGRLALNFYSPQQQAAKRSWNDFGVWYTGLVGQRRALQGLAHPAACVRGRVRTRQHP